MTRTPAAVPPFPERMEGEGKHTRGWRLSAGDEHTVFDGSNARLVSVPCGGMTGRTFKQAADCARLIAAAPEMLAMLEHLADGEGPVLHHDLLDLIDRVKGNPRLSITREPQEG